MNDRTRLAGDEPFSGIDSPQPDRVDLCLAALAYGQIDELADSRVTHDYRFSGSNGPRGNDSAVEDEVRTPRQEDLVLRAGGFALGAVPDDDGPASLACHSGQLEGRGEARTASAAKTGTIHELDQLAAG
jgi:hypothetical protein